MCRAACPSRRAAVLPCCQAALRARVRVPLSPRPRAQRRCFAARAPPGPPAAAPPPPRAGGSGPWTPRRCLRWQRRSTARCSLMQKKRLPGLRLHGAFRSHGGMDRFCRHIWRQALPCEVGLAPPVHTRAVSQGRQEAGRTAGHVKVLLSVGCVHPAALGALDDHLLHHARTHACTQHGSGSLPATCKGQQQCTWRAFATSATGSAAHALPPLPACMFAGDSLLAAAAVTHRVERD